MSRNGEKGYIASPQTPEDYYRIVKDAIANIGNVSSKEIQNEYKAEYSMVACAQKYFDLYKKYSLYNYSKYFYEIYTPN